MARKPIYRPGGSSSSESQLVVQTFSFFSFFFLFRIDMQCLYSGLVHHKCPIMYCSIVGWNRRGCPVRTSSASPRASGERTPLRFSPGSCPQFCYFFFLGRPWLYPFWTIPSITHNFGRTCENKALPKNMHHVYTHSRTAFTHGSRRMLIIHVCCFAAPDIHTHTHTCYTY